MMVILGVRTVLLRESEMYNTIIKYACMPDWLCVRRIQMDANERAQN